MADYGTRFEFSGTQRDGDVLIVPVATSPKPPMKLVAGADQLCDGAVTELLAIGSLDGEAGKLAHSTRGGKIKRIVVAGLGNADDVDGQRIRTVAGRLARWLIDEGVTRATLWIDGLLATHADHPASAWAEGMALAGFCFDAHKKLEKTPPKVIHVALRSSDAAYVTGRPPRIRDAVAIAESVNYARRLAHEPANVLHPMALAAEAKRFCKQHKFKCTVLAADELKRRGMNGLLAVGRGAESQPCLIRMDYTGAPRTRQRTVIIGKAVTFDTGGYSLKDKAGLEGLKFDKCGGAAVFGIMQAVAALKLRGNVTALVPAAENAISDKAYRPGDIITMMSGKTVEIISTDAEGRMILADALWYAQKHCKPTTMINLATLTGGVGIALGKAAAGLMSNNEELANDLEECGRATHERLWPFPLWDDYRELIRGNDSDIRNSSGKRQAHAIVGGIFLKEFVEDTTPWAHLDIAAVATDEAGIAATGFGVRLLVEYLRRRTKA